MNKRVTETQTALHIGEMRTLDYTLEKKRQNE